MLSSIPHVSDSALIVGYGGHDDAAVYRIDEHRAIVTTVDFITPPVDDPYWFGQIGAANSLSDIYAMGAKPLIALNLVMYPMKKLGKEILKEILKGAGDKVNEAGAVMGGGHSVDDEEPKFGLCVTGIVNMGEVIENRGAQPGDIIVLTKPVGTGVIFNGVKSGRLPYREAEKLLPEVSMLNGVGLSTLKDYGVRALTDVTGFGLGGHIFEIARGSGVSIRVNYENIPIYPNALDLYGKGETTGSNVPNMANLEGHIRFEGNLSKAEKEIIFDPQTSGGLIAAMPRNKAEAAVESLKKGGYGSSAVIGDVVEKEEHHIIIV